MIRQFGRLAVVRLDQHFGFHNPDADYRVSLIKVQLGLTKHHPFQPQVVHSELSQQLFLLNERLNDHEQ